MANERDKAIASRIISTFIFIIVMFGVGAITTIVFMGVWWLLEFIFGDRNVIHVFVAFTVCLGIPTAMLFNRAINKSVEDIRKMKRDRNGLH